MPNPNLPPDWTARTEAALCAFEAIINGLIRYHCTLDHRGDLVLPADDIARQSWTLAEAFAAEGERRHG